MQVLDVLGEKPDSQGQRRAHLIKNGVVDESTPTTILTPTSGTCLDCLLHCVIVDRRELAYVIFSLSHSLS